MTLNEKILYCRKKAGLSQLDLADLLGVSRQSVSKWETGEANPEVTKIPQLAEAFGVSADWLLSEEEPEDQVPPASQQNVQPAYPEWVEHLPAKMGTLVRKYGWLFGIRIAVGGLMLSGIGILARVLFHKMIFGFSSGMGNLMGDFNSSAWGIFSLFTGVIIAVGVVLILVGALLAIALKIWGKKK